MRLVRVTENLFLSSKLFRQWYDIAAELGITAIVNLIKSRKYRRGHKYDPGPRFLYLHEGIPDRKRIPHEVLARIYKFIDANIETGKVLITCESGISRSGGIVVGELLRENPSWSWEEAFAFVRQVRPINPAPEIKSSILEFLGRGRGEK